MDLCRFVFGARRIIESVSQDKFPHPSVASEEGGYSGKTHAESITERVVEENTCTAADLSQIVEFACAPHFVGLCQSGKSVYKGQGGVQSFLGCRSYDKNAEFGGEHFFELHQRRKCHHGISQMVGHPDRDTVAEILRQWIGFVFRSRIIPAYIESRRHYKNLFCTLITLFNIPPKGFFSRKEPC
jgi:hypothetical protein